MPEGHSVHRLARQFTDVFGGSELAVSSPQGKFTAGAQQVDGHVLELAQAHGKQLFLYFSHELVMRVHLGLYGAWDFGGDSTFTGASSIGAPRRIGEQEVAGAAGTAGGGRGEYAGPPEPRGAVRARLVSAHGWADLRGPSACEVLTLAEAAIVKARLGPDPLHNRPGDRDEFVRRLRKSTTSVALQLMKQEVLAGVGNVYRAEALFRRSLNPSLPGASLQVHEAQALWDDIALVMADGANDGRIITTELADRPSGIGAEVGHALAGETDAAESGTAKPTTTGGGGEAQSQGTASNINNINKDVPVEDAHYVYKRNGLPCRHCGTVVALTEVGGRKLYWCPECQK